MSRVSIYRDSRLHVVGGDDHMLGRFIQLFDKEMESETPEGEGLVFDWSEGWGVERNYTGIPSKDPEEVIAEYIIQNKSI